MQLIHHNPRRPSLASLPCPAVSRQWVLDERRKVVAERELFPIAEVVGIVWTVQDGVRDCGGLDTDAAGGDVSEGVG